jgi:hypothetical protein
MDRISATSTRAGGGVDRPGPYLSIVACSRNDGHGENLIERMQLFINGIADQAGRYCLDCELILVDWNPPPDKPGLAEALQYPDGGGHLASRVIVVPPELHARLPHADVLPLFQMLAKNVGIRRARGRMVLSTNIDILFPDQLMEWLAKGDLDHDALYRVDRADIKVPFGTPAASDLACVRTLPPVRVHRRDGTYDGANHRVIPLYASLADILRYRYLHRWRSGSPPEVRPAKPARQLATPWDRLSDVTVKAWRLTTLRKPHVLACGDFTLMSRDNWMLVGGHAEWPMYSWNLDALLLYQARAFGIREINLPAHCAVMHMDHSKGSGWTPDGAGELFARMTERGVPVLTDDRLAAETRELGLTTLRRRRPLVYNRPDWGCAGAAVDEILLPASRHTAPAS